MAKKKLTAEEQKRVITFKKHCLIKHDKAIWQAICVDDSVAVFAYAGKTLRSNKVDYRKLFVVSQSVLDGFEYELILEGRNK